jgi:aspartate/methionine/tyrosine aminotransferase
MQGGSIMPSYQNWSTQQLDAEINRLEPQLQAYIAQKLKLNMTRGKPCAGQLNLSSGLATCLSPDDYLSEDGTDCRNYGGLDGLIETRRLFAGLLGTRTDQVMVIGNSSLNLMYDMMVRCLLFPLPGSDTPWSRMDTVRFICPVPGYDRHFFVTQSLGIEMIPVPMTPQGPDMDLIESLVAADATIKGMWLVPVYSNPDGITCSAGTCRRLAAMKTAAADFRIFWDNAYVVHHLDPENPETTPEILSLCEESGNPDRVFAFSSTSKITWAGAGIACIASSLNNLAWIRKHMTAQTIGPDKMNQLRHARFLKDQDTVQALMRSQAEILRPKFELVDRYLTQELADTGFCHWNKPGGGYFYSLFVLPGTAAEVVRLARTCGVELTPAGSTWPCGKDPTDSNIRLAPSFPPLAELEKALQILCLCVRLAALKQLRATAGGNHDTIGL